MIVCLFGPSCVGKTTLAKRVAAALGLPLRSCGDAVRTAATVHGTTIKDLPDEGHREVDAGTVAWALEHKACIVEGRYLDRVFADSRAAVTLILIGASDACRVSRLRDRSGNTLLSAEDLRRSDDEDNAFRERLFGDHATAMPWQVLDTSGLTVDECAQQLSELIEQAICQTPG
jgi:cytidylate kinase